MLLAVRFIILKPYGLAGFVGHNYQRSHTFQRCFLLGGKQGAIEGKIGETAEVSQDEKRPHSSKGHGDSGGSVWAGALHGGAEEGHFSTLRSAPGSGLWQAAIPPLPPLPCFTLCNPSAAQQHLSFPQLS
ncbi:unnamed protein product [Pleuronectes platessa]|uniref:Uncharacterized protein n=1 Tax=Pleuronectes platessa TaxID=8262 RepID=A0A9N7VL36_PLEPL|nr:unnamed protein product [Pleuronectes platessa]